jgi:DNA-binding MarR family transcriptional regulator
VQSSAGTETEAPDSEVLAWEALTRVLVGISWDSAHAAPDGVTFPQFRMLLILGELGQVSCSVLAAALGVNASSVTRLADKLEARGYLARGADPRNRSVVAVAVTDAGRQVVAQVLARRHAALGALLGQLSAGRRQAAARVARELVDAAASTRLAGASGPGRL